MAPPGEGLVVVDRHRGETGYTLPHKLDQPKRMAELRERGCDRVLAIGSVGSLHSDFAPGTFVCPDDFIALHLGGGGPEDESAHRVDGFDMRWRAQVCKVWAERAGVGLREGATYWQSLGPRLETAAEVEIIADYADIVGMTIAGECLAACDEGLAYAAVCVVDNLANGIEGVSLNMDELEASRERNRTKLAEALNRVVPALAEAAA